MIEIIGIIAFIIGFLITVVCVIFGLVGFGIFAYENIAGLIISVQDKRKKG